jgi:chromosome segregation ATPase
MDPWHSIDIKVPEKMMATDKHGQKLIRNTLTPQKSLSRSNKVPSINLIPTKLSRDDLHRELEYQKDKLRSKLEDLKERSGDNEKLGSVLSDYESMYQHMKKQDESHQSQLEFILKYIEDIKETRGLTEEGLAQIKHEQDTIFGRLQEIKQKISDINV